METKRTFARCETMLTTSSREINPSPLTSNNLKPNFNLGSNSPLDGSRLAVDRSQSARKEDELDAMETKVAVKDKLMKE